MDKREKELVDKFIKLDKLQKYEIKFDMSHGDLVYEFMDSLHYMDEEDLKALEEEIDLHLDSSSNSNKEDEL